MHDPDPFGTRAPFWRRHWGIAHPWSPRPIGRKGCLITLYGGFAVIVLVLVIAGIAAMIR